MAPHDLPFCYLWPQEDVRMIFLRLLSFFVALAVPMLPPLMLSDSTRGMPGWPVLGGLFGISLICASFLYIALAAPRMRRSLPLRILGGVLLMIPASASFILLWTQPMEDVLWPSVVLLAAALLMFIGFVFPAIPDRRQRPMRARDREEPVLP
jgi:hypothetical protein